MRTARTEGNNGMGPATTVAGVDRRRLVGAVIDFAATTAGKLRCAVKEEQFRWRAALGSASAHRIHITKSALYTPNALPL